MADNPKTLIVTFTETQAICYWRAMRKYEKDLLNVLEVNDDTQLNEYFEKQFALIKEQKERAAKMVNAFHDTTIKIN